MLPKNENGEGIFLESRRYTVVALLVSNLSGWGVWKTKLRLRPRGEFLQLKSVSFDRPTYPMPRK